VADVGEICEACSTKGRDKADGPVALIGKDNTSGHEAHVRQDRWVRSARGR